MVTVVRPNNLVIDSEQGTIEYLSSVILRPEVPFPRGQFVQIVDRSQILSHQAFWDIGIVINCPSGIPTCWILVLNTDGSTSVIAIPKAHLVAI